MVDRDEEVRVRVGGTKNLSTELNTTGRRSTRVDTSIGILRTIGGSVAAQLRESRESVQR